MRSSSVALKEAATAQPLFVQAVAKDEGGRGTVVGNYLNPVGLRRTLSHIYETLGKIPHYNRWLPTRHIRLF